MDPRLIELNPRIDEPAPPGHQSTAAVERSHSPETSLSAAIAGTRKQVGHWLVDLGTALEGGSTQHSASAARR